MRRLQLSLSGAATCALLLFADALSAQTANPFGSYQRELAGLPAPDWMKEGTRLIWEISSASLPEPGGGQRSAGTGITTVDIVSLIGNTAAVASRTQIRSSGVFGGEALAAPIEQGGVFQAAWGLEFWVHPEVLAKTFHKMTADGPWKGIRGPYEVDGKKFPAIQFVTGGGERDLSRTSLVYEERTGILLFSTQANRRHAGDTLHPTAVHKFLLQRDRKLPWAEGRPPLWLAHLAVFEYSGSRMMQSAGLPPIEQPISVRLKRDVVGSNFVSYRMSDGQAMAGVPATEIVRVSGPTQVGGLWLPPLEIKKLKRGQRCDRDPITGANVSVAFVGRTDYGRQVVTLVEEAAGYTYAMDYEIETGILLVVALEDKLLGTTTRLFFTGVQRAADAPAGEGR